MIDRSLGMPAVDWQVRVRDECVCSYCGLSGNGNFEVWMNLSIDHIMPGGGDGAENKTVACGGCNTLKAKYSPAGETLEARIADARRVVQERRERSRPLFEKMMDEIKKHSS